ncbi:MAG: hypothetical protein AUJ08_01590 [Thaumarchaeota archaeon 13_1_40CM_3_50_5]|nr:MAG: hypothetical protein AUH71_04365 [Thaumarchaeota archaeon 13_1_40CM_4_48_7]OLC86797.1 MAG: hypothetical protein AUJ08_01590 [Thaumarchaeota archaeon 13_1_40CM_3_50_5]TLY06503.1 MAG: hypothetical protein E6K88_08095 [Nitrososphaerota archaeon]
MRISELCKMIEDSIRSGRYPLDTDVQKKLAAALQVINRSDGEDLKGSNIRIETRVQELYVVSNYVPNIEHLPGVIELDIIDSFKMICRKLERLDHGIQMK